MWICPSNRDAFIKVLKAERLLEPFDLPKLVFTEKYTSAKLREFGLVLTWREDPRRSPCLPDLIILPDGELQDFLAWTSTYLGDYRPLTAQLRVLEVSAADRYFGAKYARPEGWLEAVFAGLIICETLTYFDIERDPNAIPGVAFFSSYSFSRARHAVLWNGESRSSGLLDDWISARRFGGQEVPSDITPIMNPIWELVDGLSVVQDEQQSSLSAHVLVQGCLDIARQGSLGSDAWADLIGESGFHHIDHSAPGLLREDRVTALMAAAEAFKRRPSLSAQFICAYLANAIAPGTLDHFALVRKLFPEHRATLVWYGLVAGLTPHSTVRDAFRGVGRRILRDVNRPASLFDPPTADSGLAELSMIARQEGSAMVIQSGSYASVEIAPCVTTFIRWGSESTPQPREQARVSARIPRNVEHSLREMSELTKRLNYLNDRLLRDIEFDSGNKVVPSKRSGKL